MEKPSSEEKESNSIPESESNQAIPSTTSTVPKQNQIKPQNPSKRCLEKTKIMKRYIESKFKKKNIEKILK